MDYLIYLICSIITKKGDYAMNSKHEFYKIPPALLSNPKLGITIAERHSGKRNYELYVKNKLNNKMNDSSCKDDCNEGKTRILFTR